MPRAGLGRAVVVQAAARLLDEEGPERLTFARLAEGLGVRAPSLYNHVPGLDGLQRELALHGLRELAACLGRAAVGQAGDDAILAIARAYRDFARARPGLYAATLRAPDPADAELRGAGDALIDIVGAGLAAYGLRGDDALHATRGLRAVVHGFASLEAAGGFGLPLGLDESFARLVRAFSHGLRGRARPLKP